MQTNILFLWVFICLLLACFILFVLYRLRSPRCGGYLDPQSLFCDKRGQIVSSNSCGSPTTDFVGDMATFLDYIRRAKTIQGNEDVKTLLSPLGKTYKGLLLFAIPELLKILPSDFGQNYISPYGFISFFDSYFPCIDNVSDFCRFVTRHQPAPFTEICRLYVEEQKAKNQECPFPIRDDSPGVLVQDKGFFNAIGLLGAFSLTPSQIVVFYQEIPVAKLNLMYWSFNLYIVDSLDPGAVCSPYRQINFASIASSFNMFHSVGLSGKRFNPLVADKNTVKKGYVCVYVTISINPLLSEKVEQLLKSSKKPFDAIRSFVVATGKDSVRLDPTIPNPNTIPRDAAAFDPKTQRLACLLRVVPDPAQNQAEKEFLHNYIYGVDNRLEVVLLESNIPETSRLDHYFLPMSIAPIYDEKQNLTSQFRDLQKKFLRGFSSLGFVSSTLPTRNSLLNVVAPFYRHILNTKHSFEGGYQAIQLAGNAQGDNPDAHYRLSKAVCLTGDEVFLGLCVNHLYYKNTVFNSINIVDVNKAYGYDGFTTDPSYPFYVVLTGRDNGTLNLVRQRLAGSGVVIKTIYLDTEEVPVCNRVLMVERIYLNNLYRSQKNPETLYNLVDVFGGRYRTIDESLDADAYESLRNLTRPDLDRLISPFFCKATRIDWNIIFVITIIVLSVIVVVMFALHLIK